MSWKMFALWMGLILAALAAFVLLFVPWMDAGDQRHRDHAKADMLVACGENKSIEVKSSNNGWTYNVTCQRSDGSVYLEVVG